MDGHFASNLQDVFLTFIYTIYLTTHAFFTASPHVYHLHVIQIYLTIGELFYLYGYLLLHSLSSNILKYLDKKYSPKF